MRRFNLPLIIAIFLIAVAGFGFYSAFRKAQDSVAVMVASNDLPPFIAIQEGGIEPVEVPRGSVTEDDIEQSEYEALVEERGGSLIPVIIVLKGQRLNEKAIAEDPQSSFSIVLPDERVVAVTASVPGAVLGAIQPGAVVDVQTAGRGSDVAAASFAKVLCVAADAKQCEGVLPAGQQLTVGGEESGVSSSNSGGPIKILLVVAADEANKIAGQNVTVSLNTFCRVDPKGYFVSVQEARRCEVPLGGRLAATPGSADGADTTAEGEPGTETGTETSTSPAETLPTETGSENTTTTTP